MPKNDNISGEQLAQSCYYNLASEGLCTCQPHISEKLCHCIALSKRRSRDSLPKPSHVPHASNLVAYIRLGGQQPAREEQARLIAHYCTQHGFRLAKTFVDIGKPSQQLQNALQELEEHDGLIAVDLNSFVEHENDRIRDLRPFIHHFFCHQSKHLITIQEGIDTGSAAGQMAAIEFASQDKDNF